jgi:hypothetical protein
MTNHFLKKHNSFIEKLALKRFVFQEGPRKQPSKNVTPAQSARNFLRYTAEERVKNTQDPNERTLCLVD